MQLASSRLAIRLTFSRPRGNQIQQWKSFAHFRLTPVPTARLGQGYNWPLTVLRANCLFVSATRKFDLSAFKGESCTHCLCILGLHLCAELSRTLSCC